MSGDFGTPKEAKLDAPRGHKNVQNGLTPVGPGSDGGRLGVEWGSGGHMSGSRAPRKHSLVMIYKETKKQRNKVEGLKG